MSQELEYLAMIAQDFISTQPRSVQIAMAERCQHCVNAITSRLQELEAIQNAPVLTSEPTGGPGVDPTQTKAATVTD